MAQPSPYNRAFNFSNYQAQNPTSPLPGAQVDIELSRLKAVTDEIRSVIAALQRDDLALSNRSVGYDQLKPELDGFGFNPPRAWATATNYVVRDTAFANSGFYQCLVSHTSGTFSTDLAAGKWELIADFSEISAVTDASYLASGTLPDARLSFTVTDYAKTILDDADDATARATLGVTIGTHVQAYNSNLTTWQGKTAPSGTVVGTSDTQTLTNKTLTSPTISGGAISSLATDLPVADGGTGASTASAAFDNLKQAATESATGVVELATTAEAVTGTDTARAVTPAGVQAFFDDKIYTGSTRDNTTFPVGTTLLATNGGAPNRNASVTVRLGTLGSATYNYHLDGAGTALAGTWRACGTIGAADGNTDASRWIVLVQRVS